jgi:hypothetical protein
MTQVATTVWRGVRSVTLVTIAAIRMLSIVVFFVALYVVALGAGSSLHNYRRVFLP